MKRLILCALAVAGLCIPALATDPTPEQKAQIEKPMTMNNTGNEKKQVIFTHSAHAKTDCAFCHHKAVEGNIYVGCASQGLHDNLDKKDKSDARLLLHHAQQEVRKVLHGLPSEGCGRKIPI